MINGGSLKIEIVKFDSPEILAFIHPEIFVQMYKKLTSILINVKICYEAGLIGSVTSDRVSVHLALFRLLQLN